MSDIQDPLNQLWQKQDVVTANLSEVSKKWRKVRFKQWCYVASDVLSLLICFVLIWYKAEELDRFTMTLIFGVMLLSVITVTYITWLRRFSFGWSSASTDQHILKLQKQIENNIKIAKLSLYSVWFIAVVMVIFLGGLFYFDVFPVDRLINKVLLTLTINAVMLPCIWIWASKRKKRFTNELAEIKCLLEGVKF
jgi:hypothetical protein